MPTVSLAFSLQNEVPSKNTNIFKGTSVKGNLQRVTGKFKEQLFPFKFAFEEITD